jgi:hypothetical protein
VELVVEPDAGRCSAEEVVIVGEALPDRSRISFDGRAVARRNPQRLHRQAARVQQPEDVVIRNDEERGRLGKRRILVEQRGVDVPVRADEGQLAGLVVERARHIPDRRVRIEEPILMQNQRLKVSALQGRFGVGNGSALAAPPDLFKLRTISRFR